MRNNNSLNQHHFMNFCVNKLKRVMYSTFLIFFLIIGICGVSSGQSGNIGFGTDCDVSTPICENTSTYPEILSCPDAICTSGNLEYCWYVLKPGSTDFIPVAGSNGNATYETNMDDFNGTPATGNYKFRRYFKCVGDCPNTITSPWMDCSNEVIVVVTAAPNAGTISGTQNICSNGSTQLSTSGTSGTWSIMPPTVATINSSGLVNGVGAGMATVSYTLTGTGGCSNSVATYTINVTAAPNAGIISGTQNICSNGSTQLSTSGTSGTWSIMPTTVATINSTGLVNGVSAGMATVSYIVTGTGGCSNSVATYTINVTAAPNAGIISGTQNICSNGSTQISTSGTSGTWSIMPPTVATINSSGLVNGVGAGMATVSYTVPGTGGCSNAVSTYSITVNPLPTATISLPTEVCQDGDAELVIKGIIGSPPYTFTYNGLNANSDNSGIFRFDIPSDTPGNYIYELSSVTDTNGCTMNNLNSVKSIIVWKNPEAKFDIIGINSEFNTFFTLDASSTSPGSNSSLSYFWTFDPALLQQGKPNPIPNSNEQILEKLYGSNGDINQKFTLKVIDQNNCMSEIVKSHPWGAAVNCQVSLGNNNKYCTQENTFSDSISLTTNIAFVDSDDKFTFKCEDCEVSPDTIKPNKKDFKIKITVNNVGGQKLIKLKTKINQNENGGCTDVESDIDILIQGAGLIEKENIKYKSNICVGDVLNSMLTISNIVPTNNVEIEYENGSLKNKVTSINGSVQIPLDVLNSGPKIIKLLKITNNNNNTGCSRDLLDFEFSYTVTECRQPDLKVEPFIAQDTYCLNQSGITFNAKDINDYRGFKPITKEYSWKILSPDGQQLASSQSDEIQAKDSSVVLYLKNSKFLTFDSIHLVGTLASNYQGINPFLDEFNYTIRISKSKEAPDRSTIARYPGYVYFLEDTTAGLCVQWGLANKDFTDIDTLSNLPPYQVSQNGYALFGDNELTQELESNIPKKYLWADTWFKAGPTCDFATAECITRTYYNTSLPPKGAPRSTPDTYQAVIYPNPTTGQFTLALQGDWSDTFTVDLLDYTGRQVAQLGQIDKALYKTETNLNIQGTPSGMYLLRVTDSTGHIRIHKVVMW